MFKGHVMPIGVSHLDVVGHVLIIGGVVGREGALECGEVVVGVVVAGFLRGNVFSGVLDLLEDHEGNGFVE